MRKHELKNCPQWLMDARTENEDVNIVEGIVQWNSGDFIGGDFMGGNFRGGNFLRGNFMGNFWGGNFWSGKFMGGNFLGGNFMGGDFIGGDFLGGEFRGGNYKDEPLFSFTTFGPINSSGNLYYAIFTKNHEYLRAGCFCGTLAELKKIAKKEGKQDYLMWCKILKKVRDTKRKELEVSDE